MTKPFPHIDDRRVGLQVLAYIERTTRGKRHSVSAEKLQATGDFPQFTRDDLTYILEYLTERKYLKPVRMAGGSTFHLTDSGINTAESHVARGLAELEIVHPHSAGTHFHIGQGANSPFQAAINTGSGTLTATQNVQIGAAQQAEVLQVLARLTEVLDNMEASTDRDTAAAIVRTATEAAQKSAWDIFAGRMQGALAFLAMLASLTADGATALELGQKALTLISGGT